MSNTHEPYHFIAMNPWNCCLTGIIPWFRPQFLAAKHHVEEWRYSCGYDWSRFLEQAPCEWCHFFKIKIVSRASFLISHWELKSDEQCTHSTHHDGGGSIIKLMSNRRRGVKEIRRMNRSTYLKLILSAKNTEKSGEKCAEQMLRISKNTECNFNGEYYYYYLFDILYRPEEYDLCLSMH